MRNKEIEMTRKIYKFPLNFGKTKVSMPETAKIRHVEIQHEKVCIWVEVEPNQPTVEWAFSVYGTGWSIEHDEEQWCGTVMTADGAFVWHVFTRLKMMKLYELIGNYEVTDPHHGGKTGVRIEKKGGLWEAKLSPNTTLFWNDQGKLDIDQESDEWDACVTLSEEEARNLYLTLDVIYGFSDLV
jgi:hypothetical protein